MRHQRHRTSLGLKTGHRKAVMRNLAKALIKHNRIITTVKKAKITSQFVDTLITLAKRNDMHVRRQLFAQLQSRDLVKHLVDVVAPRFVKRNGGYTRIIRYAHRRGDGALMAIVEFTEIPEVEKTTKDKKKRKKTQAKENAESSVAKESAEKKDKKSKKEETVEDERTSQKDQAAEERPKKSGFFTNLRGYLKK